jgi:hypothetical protein
MHADMIFPDAKVRSQAAPVTEPKQTKRSADEISTGNPAKASSPTVKASVVSDEAVRTANPTVEEFYKARPLSEYSEMTSPRDKLESLKEFIISTSLDARRYVLVFELVLTKNSYYQFVGPMYRLEAAADSNVVKALVSFLHQPDIYSGAATAVENLLVNPATRGVLVRSPGLLSAVIEPMKSDHGSGTVASKKKALDVLLQLSLDAEAKEILLKNGDLVDALNNLLQTG